MHCCNINKGRRGDFFWFTWYSCIHQTVPKYLQELCVPATTTASRPDWYSAARGDLQLLGTRTVTLGPRSFTVGARKFWSTSPPAL